MVDNEDILNLKIESSVSGQGIELVLIIKTLVRIMPQDALFGADPTVVRTARPLFAPAEEPGNEVDGTYTEALPWKPARVPDPSHHEGG